MHNPDFHRIVTPAILYVLDRSAKNGVSITEVVRALDPDMAKLSFEAVRQRIKKTLRRFKESNRELLRHVDKGTLKEAEQFLCHPILFGVPGHLNKKGKGKKRANSGGDSNRAAVNSGATIDTRAAEVLTTTEGTGGQSADDTEQVQILASSKATSAMTDDSDSDLQAAFSSAPHFEIGAAVRTLPWTNGGGHTARIYGEAIPLAFIAGPLITETLSNGERCVGYEILRPQQQRSVFWPAGGLLQTSVSGLDRMMDTRQKGRMMEHVEDRKRLKIVEADLAATKKLLKKAKSNAKQVLGQQLKDSSNRLKETRLVASEALVQEKVNAGKRVKAVESKAKGALAQQKANAEKRVKELMAGAKDELAQQQEKTQKAEAEAQRQRKRAKLDQKEVQAAQARETEAKEEMHVSVAYANRKIRQHERQVVSLKNKLEKSQWRQDAVTANLKEISGRLRKNKNNANARARKEMKVRGTQQK